MERRESDNGSPPSRRRAWGERLLALAVGVLLTLVTAEAALRVVGWFHVPDAPEGSAPITILAEGDSFTYGIGGLSYPSQLEALLNEEAGGRLVQTVNKGVPGINTALLADDLDDHLEAHAPDLLIVVAGENNTWNAIRMTEPARMSTWQRIDAALLRSRVYKFLKVAAIGWDARRFHEAGGPDDPVERAALHLIDSDEDIGLPTDDELPADVSGDRRVVRELHELQRTGAYEACVTRARAARDADPEALSYAVSLASCQMRLGEVDAAVAVLESIPDDSPKVRELHEAAYQLGFALLRTSRPEAAIEAWTQGLVHFPTSAKLYQAVAHEYVQRGQLWRALEVRQVAPGVVDNPLYAYLERLYARHGDSDPGPLIAESLHHDMVRIIRTAQRRGVEVIVASYPYFSHPEVAVAAEETGATYIDFRPIFAAHFDSRADYISADNCHCNTAGYALMAQVFAAEANRLLDLDLDLDDPRAILPTESADGEVGL